MQTMTFPAQTAVGVEEGKTFFLLCSKVLHLSSLLRQVIMCLGDRSGLVEQFNCEVVTRIMARMLPSKYEVVVTDGYFGMFDFTETTITHCEHSWLTARSAPQWVIDPAPFNGFLSPSIVLASTFPWRGLYRPEDALRSLSPVQEKFIEDVVSMLQAIEARS